MPETRFEEDVRKALREQADRQSFDPYSVKPTVKRARRRLRRDAMFVAAFAVIAIVAGLRFGGSYMDTSTPAATPTIAPPPTETALPSPSDPSLTESLDAVPREGSFGKPTLIHTGRYYVHILAVEDGHPPALVVDVEKLYRGNEARKEAAADGKTTTLDQWGHTIYIVNDSPVSTRFPMYQTKVTIWPQGLNTPMILKHELPDLLSAFNCEHSNIPIKDLMDLNWWITLRYEWMDNDAEVVNLQEAPPFPSNSASPTACPSPG
jgi:hypothetical protein